MKNAKKSLFVCLVSVALLLVGTAANADDNYDGYGNPYDRDLNKYSKSDAASYYTVLIAKGDSSISLDSEDIYYADQSTGSAFTAAMEFALKENPEPGMYTIRMASAPGSSGSGTTLKNIYSVPYEATFAIGTETDNSDDLELEWYPVSKTLEWEDDELGQTIAVAFVTATLTKSQLETYNSLKVRGAYENGSGGYYNIKYPLDTLLEKYDLTQISGSGDLRLAIQVNVTPVQYRNTISLYLSEDDPVEVTGG